MNPIDKDQLNNDLRHCKTLEEALRVIDNSPVIDYIPHENIIKIQADLEARLWGLNIAIDQLEKSGKDTTTFEAARTTLKECIDIVNENV